MDEVVNRMKEYPVECCCGCGLVGQLRVKRWKDGTQHVKRCECRRCQGGRQTARARRREHTVAKAVHGTRNIASGAFGGVDTVGGVCDVEETANANVVRGLKRWWLSKGVQVKVAGLYRRNIRPRAFVASWDGKPQLVVMRFDDFESLCDAVYGEPAA